MENLFALCRCITTFYLAVAEILPSALEMTNPRELEIFENKPANAPQGQTSCSNALRYSSKKTDKFISSFLGQTKPQLSLISQYVRSVYLLPYFCPP